MSTVAAIGASNAIEGFAFAGVSVIAAAAESAVLDAWQTLGPDVGLVILTPHSLSVLEPHLSERPQMLTIAMP
jgi:vacuolar-type H+-ATPase subunit F/Vma7